MALLVLALFLACLLDEEDDDLLRNGPNTRVGPWCSATRRCKCLGDGHGLGLKAICRAGPRRYIVWNGRTVLVSMVLMSLTRSMGTLANRMAPETCAE